MSRSGVSKRSDVKRASALQRRGDSSRITARSGCTRPKTRGSRKTFRAPGGASSRALLIDGLQAEGLRPFDRLVEPPEFPIIDFRAAAACLVTKRFDQGAALAQRFLQRTEDDGLMDDPRAKARLIHAECRRLTKAKRYLARQADLLTRGDKRAAAHNRRQDWPGPPIPGVSRQPVSAGRTRRSAVEHFRPLRWLPRPRCLSRFRRRRPRSAAVPESRCRRHRRGIHV